MPENDEFFSSNGLTSIAFNSACADCAAPAVAAPQPVFDDEPAFSAPAPVLAPSPSWMR